MKIFYGKAVYDNKEINAAISVLKQKSLTLIDGPSVKSLEKKISKLFGKQYGLMVNSGSSANLLALASLGLKKGSEVITPTLTFSTTVAPIYQLGLIPHFIDVGKNTFVANLSQIKNCINKKTKAIMIPNLLGNVPDWKEIFKIAKKYKLKIIEDSADTIGYRVKNKNYGKFSDISTNSMYASHIITGAGFGGMVCFNDKKLYDKAKLLRGWGRSSAIFNESEGIKKRFNTKVDGIPYDGKYIFSDIGYNFLPSEISASFALEQLKKLPKNINKRVQNFEKLKIFFSQYEKLFELPIQQKNLKTPWLAYPLIIKDNSKIKRQQLQIFLEKRGIQTRTIFTGNILRQPIMKKRVYKKVKNAEINSNKVMSNGILIGCHHGLNDKDLRYIKKVFVQFISKISR
ncbi:MAG: NarL family transcriptional regulator [Candidatus Pelagibacter sp. TMED128]|nr:MAG: NarL family transcriptional regulator [Candidatus Pelagibacter sp. TMED128]|tara:strand:+ start:366 stop:1568 length:1203 start_codon:yes stop_codon:yes gene_type:complete